MKTTITLVLGVLLAGAMPGQRPAPNQDTLTRIIDRIVAGEQDFLKRLARYQPVLETYLQEAPEAGGAPTDHYLLGKLLFDGEVAHTEFTSSAAFRKRKGGGSAFSAIGFAQMVILDGEDFSRQTYDFEFIRREFLGDLRCLAFDVAPKDKKAAGLFVGRVWVEDQDYRIVRFNGTYSHSKPSAVFLHFDSWRAPAGPGFFAPAFVYIEDEGARGRLKGQTRLWGYNVARRGRLDELTGIKVEADKAVRDESGSQDISPVESHRSWTRQAAENVIQRLERSALLAPQGEVERVLNTVTNNLIVTNEINLEAQCRVLLTTPLETFSIGHTIVVSRGLLDVLPDEPSLAMVLADELAHIVLGHRTETRFAFSDQTMFAETETIQRLRLARSPQEVEAANRKAVEILSRSPYKDKLSSAGLFLKALHSRAARFPNLIQANLGNRLASASNLVRLGELEQQAPPLEDDKIEQIAALPLGSRIKLDSWTNQLTLIKAKPVALLSPREKMPFEVTPVLIPLTRPAAR